MAGELVGPAAANGQMWKFSTFELDFLAILLLLFDETIFSETRSPDLSTGVGFVSAYASQNNLCVVQGRVR